MNDRIIKNWSTGNDMVVNKRKSAIVFATKKRFTQKKGEEHYPVSTHYKHLGATTNGKGSLTKHYKPTVMKMVSTSIALSRVRSDETMPGKLIRLYITISKATLDYAGPLLDSQKDSIKEKFRKISYKSLRIILGLRKSSPIAVLHQICGDPGEEWRRRYLYFSLGPERNANDEYNDLVARKLMRKTIRKWLTWPQLRIANISLGARADCMICGESSVLVHHVIEHARERKASYKTIITLVAKKDSIQCLAGLDLNILASFWVFYKKNFKFKIKDKKRPGDV